jgi:hypothetical protein
VEEIWRCCSSVLSFEFFTAQIGLFEMNNISMEVDHPFHAFIDILDPDVQNEVAAGDFEHSDDQTSSMSPRVQPLLNSEDQALIASVRRVLEWEEERLQVLQAQERLEATNGALDDSFDPLMPLGYPSIEGTALFPIICTMNHSCDPNCTVLYTKDGAAHVFAVQDITVRLARCSGLRCAAGTNVLLACCEWQEGEELCISYIDVDQEVDEREECLRYVPRLGGSVVP